MATLQDRLSEFTTDTLPNDEISVELLCRDNRGTYLFPIRAVALIKNGVILILMKQ